MSDKQKNLIIRSISGVIFLAIMIVGMVFRPDAFIFLFTLITGMTIWEYTGLVNELEDVTINRFISTIAGMYLFLAVAAIRTGYVDNFIVFVPYILSIVYLFVSELYTKNKNAIHDWAYTMLAQMYIALPFSLINILACEVSPDGPMHQFDKLLALSIFIFFCASILRIVENNCIVSTSICNHIFTRIFVNGALPREISSRKRTTIDN